MHDLASVFKFGSTLLEYNYDERGKDTTSPSDGVVFVTSRLAMNDVGDPVSIHCSASVHSNVTVLNPLYLSM